MCVCVFADGVMAGWSSSPPPMSAGDQGSDGTRGVYQANQHGHITGASTNNCVETHPADQATDKAPKNQWKSARTGAEMDSEGAEVLVEQNHRCLMSADLEEQKTSRVEGLLAVQREAGSGQRAAGSGQRGTWRARAWGERMGGNGWSNQISNPQPVGGRVGSQPTRPACWRS